MLAHATTTEQQTGLESLSDRVRPHLESIAERAAETEAARSVPVKNIDIIRDAGFVRALAPAEVGGDERDLRDYCDGVRTLTKACPSTGWVAGVLNVHQAAMCHYDASVRDEVWAAGADTIICSSGTPMMKAKLADGGVVVSGRGRWSSGCEHAEWAIVGMKVPDVSDAQFPERRYRDFLFMAHRSEYTIDDTWFATGMRGSGSHDLVFDQLFVPHRRMEGLDAMTFGYSSGAGSIDNWISRIPFPAFFSVFLPAVALGCADGMVEEYTKRQRSRKNAYTGAQGILNPAGHLRLAESVHELESLTAYYRHLLDSMQRFGQAAPRLTEATFHDLLQKLPFVTHRAVDVVERLFVGAGSSAIMDGNPMQRYWRDAHAARMHTGSDYDVSRLHHGRNLIGLMPTPDL
jgi:alkylation response protein AidB-like acyl-CoA dehydrogenase